MECQRSWHFFLRENFPCSRKVLKIGSDVARRMESIAKAFPAKEKNYFSEDVLTKMNEFLTRLSKELGNKNVKAINDIIDWLGFHSYGPQCRPLNWRIM